MQQPPRSIPIGILTTFSALVLATGGGVAWWTWKSASEPPATPSLTQPDQPAGDRANSTLTDDPTKSQKSTANSVPATADKTLQVYWLKPSGNTIQLVPSPVKTASNTSEALLETALKQLLAGTNQPDLSTTIPVETELLNLSVKANGIHVDLSESFIAGGGSSSMQGRLAQVLYTVTSLNPNTPVWLSVAGKPLETLGGEGLMLPQPITRQQFQQDFSLE